jgi:hypothetical protein
VSAGQGWQTVITCIRTLLLLLLLLGNGAVLGLWAVLAYRCARLQG